MEIYNENITYDNPFVCVKIFETNRTASALSNWHYHKQMEILVLLEGKLETHVDDDFYELGPGDILLIGSSQLHRDRTLTENSRYYVFQFDMEYYMEPSVMPYYKLFTEPDFPLNHLNYIFAENEEVRRLTREAVREIHEESIRKEEGYEMAVSLLIKKIFLTLIRNDTSRLLTHPQSADLIRLKPVLDYVEEHIEHKIQVEDASRVANVSYYYFVKYFKKVLGMSFLEYVNYKKIKRAERYLLTKDMSIAEVGEAIGMPNMAHFYKLFKKYNGCSPNEYRKKMLEWTH